METDTVSSQFFERWKSKKFFQHCANRLRKMCTLRHPSNDRDWSDDLVVLPEILFKDDGSITIKNIRNFTYRSVMDYTPGYYDRTLHPSQIESVWFMVEPFSLVAAHTLVSFGLDDGTYIVLSVEIRKRRGQIFSQLMVLFFLRRHELVYVIGDERDLIKLRTNYRKDDVYLYPVEASPEKVREFFIDMLKRARHLQDTPEFYNPFTNTCLTNIVAHANAVAPKRVPFSYKILLATYADKFAHEIGLLNPRLSFRELKKKYYMNERALQAATDPDFSRKIRMID